MNSSSILPYYIYIKWKPSLYAAIRAEEQNLPITDCQSTGWHDFVGLIVMHLFLLRNEGKEYVLVQSKSRRSSLLLISAEEGRWLIWDKYIHCWSLTKHPAVVEWLLKCKENSMNQWVKKYYSSKMGYFKVQRFFMTKRKPVLFP